MHGGAQAQDFAAQRARMADEVDALYAETRAETGLARMSAPVRKALLAVERHRLVPPEQSAAAYRNHPLPIGSGQTISQPYIVALSSDLLALEPGDKVLDVGTGSGYQAAVLAEMGARVFSIELVPALAQEAMRRLAGLGYRGVQVRIGDGYAGWPEEAPFDAIVVTAAAPHVPQALLDQLRPGGRLVIPVGGEGDVQVLQVLHKRADGSVGRKSILAVRFVPLVPGK